eukprot:CAMPEP_0201506516 /NCGR_PEP_ID=MMETSP0161_2-20130828/452_1 /ASSEMBLY_ACC=CAM_ASM_000251 /TAXON_ID=180227 /ORGANISM="Neoparamoeba aestuarina, Strain SoJaBio B1-5/56/2" /LENGTH=124 /DNA_ID=CAMNT_0047900633 /DNA_START=81 /DNA_END=451 /DNA_ORIENTATION=-
MAEKADKASETKEEKEERERKEEKLEEKLKGMKEEELAYPEGKMERVSQKHLVAIDGSAASNDAFSACLGLMEKEMDVIHLVSFVEPGASAAVQTEKLEILEKFSQKGLDLGVKQSICVILSAG